MSSLVPEVRADKNGKLVTRHVKLDNGSIDLSKGMPSPSVQKGNSPSQEAISVGKELSEYTKNALKEKEDREEWLGYEDDPEYPWEDTSQGYDPADLLSPEEVTEAVLALPRDTAGVINEKMSVNDDDYNIALLHALRYKASPQEIEYLTFFHQNVWQITSADFGDEDQNSYTAMADVMGHLDDLSKIGYSAPAKIFEATPEEATMVMMLNIVWEDTENKTGSPDYELMKLMIEESNRVEEIVDLHTRLNMPSETIREALKNHSSVAEGTL